ncbi:hypothetical protein Mth01_02710 [Sphaerimonospora thailandensis]|uniref:DUF397 domain-containing protein n=2 Tax=Sphaerimonospora thailandensis TaxID=795644 RepID=A0A8J3R407_9ACTN|nr:hypothetical protein Mth01_02710 [Sphaerimonospora thailandensis]
MERPAMLDLSQMRWRKASRSNAQGGQCVEVGVWSKSTRSGGNGGSCVEVTTVDAGQAGIGHKADAERLFLVRDSKDLDGPVLAFTPAEWDAFIGGVKDGEFDDLG